MDNKECVSSGDGLKQYINKLISLASNSRERIRMCSGVKEYENVNMYFESITITDIRNLTITEDIDVLIADISYFASYSYYIKNFTSSVDFRFYRNDDEPYSVKSLTLEWYSTDRLLGWDKTDSD